MLEKIVQIMELPSYIDGLCERLKEMGYADSSIKNHRRILCKFCRYADKMQHKTFDSFAVQQFVIANNGDDYDDKFHSYRYNRPFAMLNDFIAFNSVARQKYSSVSTFSEFYSAGFTSFLEYLARLNFSDFSIKNCRSHLLRFHDFLISNGVKDFSKLTSENIRAYCDTLSDYSTTTSAQMARELKKLFAFLKIHEYISEDFSSSVPNFRNTRGEKLPDKFTAEEIEKIIGAIDKNNPMGKRDYAIVLIAVRLGLRNGDVTRLKFSSLDWTNKEIHIVQQKTGVPLTLPLPDDVGWAIIDYIKNGRPDSDCEYVFVGHNPPFKQLTVYTNFVAIYMRKAGLYIEPKKSLVCTLCEKVLRQLCLKTTFLLMLLHRH
ncbi:MAG TPA: tyrosine-type recombinase/integrase [Ruminococcus sp.]|nr:tyrosine-type recombinase/integrase [Ruminococcus sp.]